jgi:hypothetical protein
MGIDVRTFDTVTGFLAAEKKADNHVSLRWTTRSWRTSWQSSSRKSSTSGWQVPRQHRSIHQPRRSLRVSPTSFAFARAILISLTECLPCSQDSGSEDRGGRGRGRVARTTGAAGHVNGRRRLRPTTYIPRSASFLSWIPRATSRLPCRLRSPRSRFRCTLAAILDQFLFGCTLILPPACRNITLRSDPSALDVTVDHFTSNTHLRTVTPTSFPKAQLRRRRAQLWPSLDARRTRAICATLTTEHKATHSHPRARTAWSADKPTIAFQTRDEDRSLTHISSQRSCGLAQPTKQSNVRHRHVRRARTRRCAESSLVAPLVGHDRLRVQRWHVPGAHLAGSAGQKQTRVARTCFDR